MNYLYDIQTYLLLEYKAINEVPLLFSDTFRKLLKKINNENSKKLLELENTNGYYPATCIDIHPSNNKMLTFINNIDYNNPKIKNHWISKRRQEIKIGKIIKSILNEIKSSEIEKISNQYQANYKEYSENIQDRLKIVEGDELVYWYDKENYKEIKGTLGNSCMNNAKYLDMYEENPETVKMLIYLDEEKEKLMGRALLWNLTMPEDRVFMDRVYTINIEDQEIFINYAERNNYLYKERQGFGGEIYDPKSGKFISKIETEVEGKDYDSYPYLDTLHYYFDNGVLNNYDDEDCDKVLLGMDGEPEGGESALNALREELEQESIHHLASAYGMGYINRNIDGDKFKQDFIEDEISAILDENPREKIERIEDQLNDPDIINFDDLVAPIIKNLKIVCENFGSEIIDIIDELNYSEFDKNEAENDTTYLVEFIKNNKLEEYIAKEVYNLEDFDKIWINNPDLSEELFESIDNLKQEEIITKAIKEQYRGVLGKEIMEELYGSTEEYSEEFIDYIKAYINKEELVNDIIEDERINQGL